jgi:aryl-alcohol dehydrogenase-like predicted oxidoreductase
MAANTDMMYRRVGNSGLKISVLGLGGWLTYVFPHLHHGATTINELN